MIRESIQRMQESGGVSRALMDGLPRSGLLVVDADLLVVSAEGDVYRDLAGRALVGRRLADLMPSARWELQRPHYLSALRGEPRYLEVTSEQHASTHAVRLTPVCEGSEVVGVMAFSRDITSETTERAAREGEELRHRAVLEALDEGVVVTDLERRLLDANAAACSMLDLDLDAARADPSWWGSLAARLSGNADSPDPTRLGDEVLATGRGLRNVAMSLDRLGGAPVGLSVNCLPWRDQSDEIAGLVMSFRDVTSKRVEHRRLVEIEGHLREALEVARLASWQWDPDTDSVTVFQALTEAKSEAGAVMPLSGLLEAVPAGVQQVARDDLAALKSGARDESIRRFCDQLPTGPVWIELRARAVRDADGRLVCVRGTSQDVTVEELAARGIASARDFFQATLDSLPARVAVLAESGEIMRTNRAWDRAEPSEGTPLGQVGDNYFETCEAAPCEELATHAAAGLRAIAAGEQEELSVEYPSQSTGADSRFVLRAARYEGPGPARIVVSHDDVTPLHRAQVKSETQAALLDEVDMAVVATDAERRITHWNRGAELLLGWTRAEVVGRTTFSLSSGHYERVAGILDELRRDGRWEGEHLMYRKDGTTFRGNVRASLLRDGEGKVVGTVAVAVDSTERIAAELDLRSARDYMRAVADSMGDGLCTLDYEGRIVYLNPRAEELLGWTTAELVGQDLHEAVQHTRADGSPYPAEECPLVAARLARSAARVDDDVLVGRSGSFLPVQQVQTPFETEDGVGGFVVLFSDISERKRQQDEAERKLHDLAWIERIRDALDHDRLVLYAQPIVEIDGGRVVQHELLIRMLDHDGSAIPPGLFLPVAERYGSIGEIDRWVTRQTVKLAAEGHRVEMNVSAYSLSDPTFYDYVESQLRHSGADPALLVFELTETAVVEDQAATENFAMRIHGLGCRLALDDFGTGYGGFTYLKQLPVDFLKIDVEFVRDLATNPASRHVVEAVVALAGGFGLQTVAEGVEDAQTLELLRVYGVDYAQGYHVGRPAPLARTFDSEGPPGR
jgi:PAS domain S-box-containing protein